MYSQQVTCHAYANQYTGCLFSTINFGDSSSGSPTSYYWNFGNGFGANTKNAGIQFDTAKTYTVTHVVSNSVSSDTCYLTIIIYPPPSPPALVSDHPSDTLCGGQLVTFTALPDTFDTYNFFVGGSLLQQSDTNVYSTWQIYNLNIIHVTVTKNGCTSIYWSNQDTMIVKAVPFVGVSSNISIICPGDIVTVSAIAEQAPTDTINFWVNSVLEQADTGRIFRFIASEPGDTIIATAWYNGCTSPFSDPIFVQATTVPTISIGGNNTICQGDNAGLQAEITLGGTDPIYHWIVNGQNMGSNSSVFQPTNLNNNDTVTCTLVSSASCANPDTVTSKPVVVSVYPVPPTPTISESGDTLTCHSTAVYYNWYFDSNIIYNYYGPQYIATQSGYYSVQAIDSGGCGSSLSYPVSITCHAYFYIVPDANDTTTYYGYNLSTPADISYLWTFGDNSNDTSTLQYPSHTYAQPGSYTICLTVTDSANGCSDTYCDSAAVLRSVNGNMVNLIFTQGTGLPEISTKASVSIYPNPASTELVISVSNFQPQWLTVYDLNGRAVSERKFIRKLDISKLSAGSYLIELRDANTSVKRTFVKLTE